MQTVRLFALLIAALFASRSEAEPSAFALHGQFERGATPDEMRFVFQLQPAPPRAPVVWLAAAAPHGERATLPVSYDRASGRYAAAFRLSPRSGEGTLQVELSDGAVRVSELHAVAIAVREHATTGPMSRSSVEGNFSVYTTPDALPQGAQVVVATLELPLQPLPRGRPLSRGARGWPPPGGSSPGARGRGGPRAPPPFGPRGPRSGGGPPPHRGSGGPPPAPRAPAPPRLRCSSCPKEARAGRASP